QKRPAHRYASAGELAEDLGRYRDGRPVRARPLGQRERLARWCRRRPAITAMGMLLAIVVTGGMTGMIVLYGQALVARSHAITQADKALEALNRSKANLYANRIALADRYRTAHDVHLADQVLDECPVSLRAWEWHYLKR